jgi:hypothetical protein
MAEADYKFTLEKLIRLGNPANNDGLTISQIMENRGHEFSKKENFILNSGFNDFNKAKLCWRLEQGEGVSVAEVISYPDLLDKYADRLV